jgi:hypothetical protein
MRQERLLKNDILNILSNKISGGAVGDIYGVDMDEFGSKKYFKLPKRIVANQPPKLFNDKDLKVEVQTRFKSRWDELWRDDIISEDYDEDRPGDFLWSYYLENRDGRPVFTDSSGRSRDMTPIQPLVSVRLDEPIYQDIDRLNLNPTYSTIDPDPPKLPKRNYLQRLVINPRNSQKPNKYYPNRFFGGAKAKAPVKAKKNIKFKKIKNDVNCNKYKNNADSIVNFYENHKGILKNDVTYKSKKEVQKSIDEIDYWANDDRCSNEEKKLMKKALELHELFKKPKAKAPKKAPKAPKKQAKTAPPISVSKTGKITKQNPWIQHVKEYRFNNNVEGLSVAQVNKEARKSYTPVSKAKKAPAKKAPAKKAPAKKTPAKKAPASKEDIAEIQRDKDLEKRILKFVGEQEIEKSKPKDCGPKRQLNPKTNRCKKVVKPQKKKRQPTEWDIHLRKVRAENPSVKGRDVMKLAKESYKKPNSNRNSLPKISSSDIKESYIKSNSLPKISLPTIEEEDEEDEDDEDIEPSKETNEILADVLEQFEVFDQEYENVFNANMSMSDKQERFDEIKSRVENYKVEIMQEYFNQLDTLSLNRINNSYEDTKENYNIYFNKVTSGTPEDKVNLENEEIIEEIIEEALASGEEDPLFNKDFAYKPPESLPTIEEEDENITIEITPKLQTNASIYPNDSNLEFSSIDIDPDDDIDAGPLKPKRNITFKKKIAKKDIPLNLRLYQNFVKIMKKNNPELSRKEIGEYWKMNKEAFIEMLMYTVEKTGGNLMNEDNYINMFKFLGGELMYGGGLSLFDGLDNYSEKSKPTSDDLSDPQNWLNTFENIGTGVVDTVGDIFDFIF